MQTLILPLPRSEAGSSNTKGGTAKGGTAGTPSPTKRGLAGSGEGRPPSASAGRSHGGDRETGVSKTAPWSHKSSASNVVPHAPGYHHQRVHGPPSSSAGAGVAGEAGEAVAADGRRRSDEETFPSALCLSCPVQRDLLAWLEGLGESSAREALHMDRVSGQQQQQQQQHCPSLPCVGADGALLTRDGGSGGGGGGGSAQRLEGGDWAKVEVLLRMVGAVARALTSRDSLAVEGAGSENGDGSGARVPVVVPREGAGAMEALVAMLPALPPVRELQRSAAVLVGGLAGWLARRPGSLEPALRTVLGVLRLEEGDAKGAPSMRDKGEDHVSGLFCRGRGREGWGASSRRRRCLCLFLVHVAAAIRKYICAPLRVVHYLYLCGFDLPLAC